MENAIAAVLTGNISQRGAAKRFGVAQSAISARLSKDSGGVIAGDHATTSPEKPAAKLKVADKAERDQWWADHQAGLSVRKISDKYGRDRLAISKEIKRREEAEAQPTPTPEPTSPPSAPEPTPAPAPSVPSAGSSTPAPSPAPQAEPRDPSLPLPQLSQDIIKREKKLAAKRAELFLELKKLQADMFALWKFAQKRWQADGRSVLRNHMGLADAEMIKQGLLKEQCKALGIPEDHGYEKILRALDLAAKDLSLSARSALYMFGYTLTMEQ